MLNSLNIYSSMRKKIIRGSTIPSMENNTIPISIKYGPNLCGTHQHFKCILSTISIVMQNGTHLQSITQYSIAEYWKKIQSPELWQQH